MHETDQELATLQTLLNDSIERAGPHLRSMFRSPMDATEVVSALSGILEVHFATVTPSGAPFVAPIDALFYRGQLWIGIPSKALRRAFVQRERRVSISYTRGTSFCLIIHGTAEAVGSDDPLVEQYERFSDGLYVQQYGEDWLDWAAKQKAEGNDGDLWRIRARRMFVKDQ
ncbi:MAG: hypothetical protein AAF525_19110 [Pseudomonadota bacterium]